MAIKPSQWIFLDGEWHPWADAQVHVTAHALHYGSSAFEGIRAYATPEGPAVFRLREHNQRLLDTCKMMHMPMDDYPVDRLDELCIEAVRRNELDSGYLRPLVFRGVGGMGLYPLDTPVSVCVFAIEWGRYLGQDAIEQGIDAMVSSWRRFNSSTALPLAKIGGQYVTNQMVSVEARAAGFGEGIMLDDRGRVAEGAGENLFLVKDGSILTPAMAQSILGGITRASVVQLAQDHGIPIREATISRDMLYTADEIFMTGTAAEVSPVRSVDRIQVGGGTRGPITEQLQTAFFDLVEGRADDPHGWRTLVR